MMDHDIGHLYLATAQSIQRRAAMVLQNVHYVIDAHFEMTKEMHAGDNPGKIQDIIDRRLQRGQCYSTPYFGTREFPAHFRCCEAMPSCSEELRGVRDLGWMLWDMDYSDPAKITPRFFPGSLRDGVLAVPTIASGEVRQCSCKP